ncbi:hypothetical protein A33M_4086 [Rhodovulum sp. PH10]|uniref:hypothetical protein n=1 Tax=Rhodovulum sp. PH10 TaxID=1187851 RepID=UPI00027C26C8|nr:hypothetical protein [Rhodovulum sp. PH10]EJW10750.1 hypothetical protein A33M_4086 [Rhodovulum sp. PH10]
MTTRGKGLLPDDLAAAWIRELRRGPFEVTVTTARLFERATQPIAGEMAMAIWHFSERLKDGRIRLHVPIGPCFRDNMIKPGQSRWPVDFDPRTGMWDSPGAAPLFPGIDTLATHVWRVLGRPDIGIIDARSALLISLARALLSVLAKEQRRSRSRSPNPGEDAP